KDRTLTARWSAVPAIRLSGTKGELDGEIPGSRNTMPNARTCPSPYGGGEGGMVFGYDRLESSADEPGIPWRHEAFARWSPGRAASAGRWPGSAATSAHPRGDSSSSRGPRRRIWG